MTNADVVSITNSGTANSESTQQTIQCESGIEIYEISVASLTVGTTYAVRIDAAGLGGPQKYVIPMNGAAANTNGGKLCPSFSTIKCCIKINAPQFLVSSWAGVASATCRVNVRWRKQSGAKMTYSDFVAAAPGTAGTESEASTKMNVVPGQHIKQINVANPDFLGSIYQVRLAAPQLSTPQTFGLPSIYEATGTEVEYSNAWSQDAINVDIIIPAGVNSISVFATADVNSTKCAIGLVLE